MARSPANAKLLVDGLFLSVFRRCYAAAPQGAVFGREGSRSGTVRKVEERGVIKEDSGASSAWAPDPITGYYRPANCGAEIDPAELREMLLNQRVRPQ